jgi:hypothetical protein
MRKHLDWITAACAIAVCIVLSFALQDRDDKLKRLHPQFVMNCVMGTDEPEGECEARWEGGVGQMKLTELDPRWLSFEGSRVGLLFKSPADQEWRQAVFFRTVPLFRCGDCKSSNDWTCTHSQMGIIKSSCADFEDFDDHIQLARKDFAWGCSPDLQAATFDNLSVTPSIDGSAGGLWHGHITNGEIK